MDPSYNKLEYFVNLYEVWSSKKNAFAVNDNMYKAYSLI